MINHHLTAGDYVVIVLASVAILVALFGVGLVLSRVQFRRVSQRMTELTLVANLFSIAFSIVLIIGTAKHVDSSIFDFLVLFFLSIILFVNMSRVGRVFFSTLEIIYRTKTRDATSLFVDHQDDHDHGEQGEPMSLFKTLSQKKIVHDTAVFTCFVIACAIIAAVVLSAMSWSLNKNVWLYVVFFGCAVICSISMLALVIRLSFLASSVEKNNSTSVIVDTDSHEIEMDLDIKPVAVSPLEFDPTTVDPDKILELQKSYHTRQMTLTKSPIVDMNDPVEGLPRQSFINRPSFANGVLPGVFSPNDNQFNGLISPNDPRASFIVAAGLSTPSIPQNTSSGINLESLPSIEETNSNSDPFKAHRRTNSNHRTSVSLVHHSRNNSLTNPSTLQVSGALLNSSAPSKRSASFVRSNSGVRTNGLSSNSAAVGGLSSVPESSMDLSLVVTDPEPVVLAQNPSYDQSTGDANPLDLVISPLPPANIGQSTMIKKSIQVVVLQEVAISVFCWFIGYILCFARILWLIGEGKRYISLVTSEHGFYILAIFLLVCCILTSYLSTTHSFFISLFHYDSRVRLEKALKLSTLEEVLEHDEASRIFSEFLQSEFSSENLEFYRVVNLYRERNVYNADRQSALADAWLLYQMYIEVGAEYQVNISSETREKLIRNLNLEDTIDPIQEAVEIEALELANAVRRAFGAPVVDIEGVDGNNVSIEEEMRLLHNIVDDANAVVETDLMVDSMEYSFANYDAQIDNNLMLPYEPKSNDCVGVSTDEEDDNNDPVIVIAESSTSESPIISPQATSPLRSHSIYSPSTPRTSRTSHISRPSPSISITLTPGTPISHLTANNSDNHTSNIGGATTPDNMSTGRHSLGGSFISSANSHTRPLSASGVALKGENDDRRWSVMSNYDKATLEKIGNNRRLSNLGSNAVHSTPGETTTVNIAGRRGSQGILTGPAASNRRGSQGTIKVRRASNLDNSPGEGSKDRKLSVHNMVSTNLSATVIDEEHDELANKVISDVVIDTFMRESSTIIGKNSKNYDGFKKFALKNAQSVLEAQRDMDTLFKNTMLDIQPNNQSSKPGLTRQKTAPHSLALNVEMPVKPIESFTSNPNSEATTPTIPSTPDFESSQNLADAVNLSTFDDEDDDAPINMHGSFPTNLHLDISGDNVIPVMSPVISPIHSPTSLMSASSIHSPRSSIALPQPPKPKRSSVVSVYNSSTLNNSSNENDNLEKSSSPDFVPITSSSPVESLIDEEEIIIDDEEIFIDDEEVHLDDNIPLSSPPTIPHVDFVTIDVDVSGSWDYDSIYQSPNYSGPLPPPSNIPQLEMSLKNGNMINLSSEEIELDDNIETDQVFDDNSLRLAYGQNNRLNSNFFYPPSEEGHDFYPDVMYDGVYEGELEEDDPFNQFITPAWKLMMQKRRLHILIRSAVRVANIFNEAQHEVFKLMETDSFRRFCASSRWLEFLRETYEKRTKE